MIPMLIVMLAIISAAVGLYSYRLLKRAFMTFGADMTKRSVKVCVVVLSFCIGVVSMCGMSFASVIVLHLIFFCLIMQFINFIVKKAVGKKYDTLVLWKKIYASCALPIAVTAAVMLFGSLNLHNIVETHYTAYTNKEIRSEGYRVALISDVHYGVSLDYKELLAVCEEISGHDADIVVLCGDIVDDDTPAEGIEEVFHALSSIKSEYGVYYVYGNHDRPFTFMESSYTEDDLESVMQEKGITVLRDGLYEVNDDLIIAGREDKSYRGGRKAIEELLDGADKDNFILTLDHQPCDYKANGKAGTDLLLSGHTHGGQIWPANLIDGIFKINDAVYGHTQIDADTQAVVTSGIAGWRYPIKTSAPAEYVIIDIKKAA